MGGSIFDDMDGYEQALVLIPVVTGSISFACSLTMLFMIRRDDKNKAEDQPQQRRTNANHHRIKRHLLTSLCISDLFLSGAYACSTFVSPKGAEGGMGISASYRGTDLTCRLQAAASQIGFAQPSYNAAICIYYLLIIRFHKSDATISKWFLPMVHGLIFSYSVTGAIVGLSTDSFHSAGALGCAFAPASLNNDDADDTVNYELLILIFIVIPLAIDFLVILVGMFWIYWTVRATEKKAQRWNFQSVMQRHLKAASKEFSSVDGVTVAGKPARKLEEVSETIEAENNPSLSFSTRNVSSTSTTNEDPEPQTSQNVVSSTSIQSMEEGTLNEGIRQKSNSDEMGKKATRNKPQSLGARDVGVQYGKLLPILDEGICYFCGAIATYEIHDIPLIPTFLFISVLAFLLCYIPLGLTSVSDNQGIRILMVLLTPLQGFFTFCIFLRGRIR